MRGGRRQIRVRRGRRRRHGSLLREWREGKGVEDEKGEGGGGRRSRKGIRRTKEWISITGAAGKERDGRDAGIEGGEPRN